jgi:hypothetical protein
MSIKREQAIACRELVRAKFALRAAIKTLIATLPKDVSTAIHYDRERAVVPKEYEAAKKLLTKKEQSDAIMHASAPMDAIDRLVSAPNAKITGPRSGSGASSC